MGAKFWSKSVFKFRNALQKGNVPTHRLENIQEKKVTIKDGNMWTNHDITSWDRVLP